MKKAVRIKSEAGFSLIELMIVVAIIGILATVAIPNFNKFQAKARQSEAKGNLSAIYSSEKSFYAEWSQYRGDFRDIGFAPEGRINYAIGFGGAGVAMIAPFVPSTTAAAKDVCFNTDAACMSAAAGDGGWTFQKSPKYGNAASKYAAVAAGCSQPKNATTPTLIEFTASAVGRVSDGTLIDQWNINEGKIACNVVSGI